MTTYPQISQMPPHMLHYGVCQNETFQLTEIQNANAAIENSLYNRRRSSTWPRVMLESEDCLDGQNGVQDEVLVIKPEVKMETDGYLVESPLPECVISPERSPSIDSSDLSQNVQVSSTQCSHKTKNKNVWGDMSYAELITKAILSSQNQRMTLAEIYAWIVENVSYFADKKDTSSTSGWKNSIRHNLSLHNKFKRVPNDTSGKSSWWTINPDKTGTKTRRVNQTLSPSPRPGTPKLGRKDSGKETPTMKRKDRKKLRCRRGSEGTINLAKLDSPLLALTRTNSSDACSGDSQTSTPMTSPVMKQRSGSFSSMLNAHSPRIGTALATTTTWNSTDVQILYGPPASPKCRLRSHSHPSHPAESTLRHTISPTIRKSSESRPNCAHSGGTPSPESISDTSQGSGTPQGSWSSPLTSPPPASTKFQLNSQRVRSSSLTMNRSSTLVGITEATKPNLFPPQITPGEYAFSFPNVPLPSQHYETLQNYQTSQQDLNSPFLPPAYSDVQFKRIGVLHTVSEPFGNCQNGNGSIQHMQPLSAGIPIQSQYMIRPHEFAFDYEGIEPKILDTQHPRVLDIKRESVGEMPSNTSSSCFQVNMHQNQVFVSQERTYQQHQFSPTPMVNDEKPFTHLNLSCQHAKNTILPQQIDLKNLQPTLISDPVSLNSLERDENFEMLDQPWRLLQAAPQ